MSVHHVMKTGESLVWLSVVILIFLPGTEVPFECRSQHMVSVLKVACSILAGCGVARAKIFLPEECGMVFPLRGESMPKMARVSLT